MHLLAAQPGGIADGSEAVDLGQSPGDIVVLSAADSELAGLAAARARMGEDFPTLRLSSLLNLTHNLSVDTYVDRVVAEARLVVVRLLGGVSYWPYGVERVVAICRARGVKLALLPGDDQPDAELAGLSLLPPEACHRLWQYCVHGGPENARNFLAYAADLIGHAQDWRAPAPMVRAGLYWPETDRPGLDDLRAHWRAGAPVAALVFYRALLQAANLAPVDALIAALQEAGLTPLSIHTTSLKDPVSAALVAGLLAAAPPAVILNATGFAVSSPGRARRATPFDAAGCPVLQVVFAGGTEAAWAAGSNGLSARDIAMNVALPEIDGRILARAVSFKTEARFDAATEASVVAYAPVADRIEFTAALAANWARLATAPAAGRRIALILANYPNRDGRIGNGVGLDTPASTLALLRALAAAGYEVGNLPVDGDALVGLLAAGPTNDLKARAARAGGERLSLAAYRAVFAALPAPVQARITARWGAPEDDPFFDGDGFVLSVVRLGNVALGLQPARGYNIDPLKTYHDPDLVPPHGYLAFYAWLRGPFDAHAVIHMGKHGNLEWLPGKALALLRDCFPEVALGPLPHIYPFIVNDPGEGTQAKRRASAVIVDHLTPPLTRAETYGPLAELELLVDEYFEAANLDPRRLPVLRKRILELGQSSGLDRDSGIDHGDAPDTALAKLDNYLCELKEMQIRDGLHIFGSPPEGRQLTDLLVALTRLPRLGGEGGDASLIRALAGDLGLTGEGGFDPLDCVLGAPWRGARPAALTGPGAWRSQGDTVERLEALAARLVAGAAAPEAGWNRTRAVLDRIAEAIRPAVMESGGCEIAGVLTALDGCFVIPGPSGAPTRGRVDVLPTGRNFYSLDSRTVPTPAAWQLGWKSAARLLDHHRQQHGAWPRRLALSAWGTSNMRTGGDDIAQGLALMGVRPRWETASRRVIGFEIMPLAVLDRPRVDVTLRVSGFFRDAFPAQIDLFDSAVRAVAALDEPEDENPLAARVGAETCRLVGGGMDREAAARRAGFRVFGSKPGAYGAGLQALIDERGWDGDADLARARVVNPKWIAGVMRHGYKGAFEMAATVDYLFAFAATARVVSDHHFDLVYDAYLDDDTVRDFLLAHNPAAAREMAERLIEAQDRGLWTPRSNSARDRLRDLAAAETGGDGA